MLSVEPGEQYILMIASERFVGGPFKYEITLQRTHNTRNIIRFPFKMIRTQFFSNDLYYLNFTISICIGK